MTRTSGRTPSCTYLLHVGFLPLPAPARSPFLAYRAHSFAVHAFPFLSFVLPVKWWAGWSSRRGGGVLSTGWTHVGVPRRLRVWLSGGQDEVLGALTPFYRLVDRSAAHVGGPARGRRERQCRRLALVVLPCRYCLVSEHVYPHKRTQFLHTSPPRISSHPCDLHKRFLRLACNHAQGWKLCASLRVEGLSTGAGLGVAIGGGGLLGCVYDPAHTTDGPPCCSRHVPPDCGTERRSEHRHQCRRCCHCGPPERRAFTGASRPTVELAHSYWDTTPRGSEFAPSRAHAWTSCIRQDTP